MSRSWWATTVGAMVETVLALDALLVVGAGGFALLAAVLATRLAFTGTARSRQGLALATSMTLAMAAALGMLRLVVATGSLLLVGIEAAAALAATLPLTAVPVLVASSVGPRLRRLAADGPAAVDGAAWPGAGPLVDRQLILPVLGAGAAAALAVALWAVPPGPAVGLGLLGVTVAAGAAAVVHRRTRVASPSVLAAAAAPAAAPPAPAVAPAPAPGRVGVGVGVAMIPAQASRREAVAEFAA